MFSRFRRRALAFRLHGAYKAGRDISNIRWATVEENLMRFIKVVRTEFKVLNAKFGTPCESVKGSAATVTVAENLKSIWTSASCWAGSWWSY